MKTVTYASASLRPSGKGHVHSGQVGPVVRGAQELLKTIDAGLWAVFEVPLSWHQRVADRHSLQVMDERLLKDIGLSRADVEHEVSKPFWRA